GFAADVNRHRSVTPESMKTAATKWLDIRNRVVVRFHPENFRADQAQVDRAKQPEVGADRAFQAPSVQTAKLDNGMQIYVVERKDLPKVAVHLATRAGSVDDPTGKEGLARFTVDVMKRGTDTMKALEIDDAMGDLGTALNSEAGYEISTLSFEVLKRNLGRTLPIVAKVAMQPSFPSEEIERERKLRLAALAQGENNPGQISARVSAIIRFGRNHPYGRPAGGYPSTVGQIAREDFVKFH